MVNTICLDEHYSTTRLLIKKKHKIVNCSENKFEIPMGERGISEGGLRTKGYFKSSYGSKPLISIVTVVYNGEKFLEDTIQSVINQTYDNIEYIIIDGGSTDGTVDIIEKYEDKIDYWVSENDDGIYDAMNKGIKKAYGELIGIINADDWYEKYTIKTTVKSYIENNKPDVIYGLLRYIKDEHEYKIDAQHHDFLEERMIPHPTCFIKKEIYEQLNYYDLSYKSAADYDLLLRIKRFGYSLIKINSILANFRTDGISTVSKIGAIESLKIKYKYNYIPKKIFMLKSIYFRIREFINV